MKKILPLLAIIPLSAFSFENGTNYVGTGINFIEIEGSIGGNSGTMEGEGFILGGNYNLTSEENKYGIDLFGGFMIANGIESNSFEIDNTSFSLGLRPFLDFEKGSLYADGQYQWGESELKLKGTNTKLKADGDTFIPSVGAQALIGDFILNPSISFIKSDLEGEVVELSLFYKINPSYTVGIEYSSADYDPVSLNGTTVTVKEEHIKIGLSYSF